MFQYTVRPGDTLYGIASQYGIPAETILSVNTGLIYPYNLIPGQIIIIPVSYNPYPAYPVYPRYPVYPIFPIIPFPFRRFPRGRFPGRPGPRPPFRGPSFPGGRFGGPGIPGGRRR